MSVDRIWYGRSAGASFARTLLAPASWLFGSVVAARNALYDRGVMRARDSQIPVVSVGNVSVGGTGKTPFTAYIVRELRALRHNPAVVMRGYGDDELHLHSRLNPGVAVITGSDRVAGIRAAAVSGADVAVLDDAFQHRRAQRDLDIVLVSAEHWRDHLRLLPAGPLREPMTSLRRADLVVVTRKSASDADARAAVLGIRALPSVYADIVTASFPLDAIVSATRTHIMHLDSLRDTRVLAIAGVGDPASFFAQLRQLGASVTKRRFRDHHDYTASDVANLMARSVGHKYVVTTEKDVVKLSRLWPANGPELWYLSQAVRLTEGDSLVAAALAKLFKRATSIVG